MSHIVTLKTKVQDVAAIEAACRRLSLPAPTQGTARLYSSQATGVIVQLPGWTYPAVIDVNSGTIAYDNFNGSWGLAGTLARRVSVTVARFRPATAARRVFLVNLLDVPGPLLPMERLHPSYRPTSRGHPQRRR